ncbi:MAG: helix-turn-helix domain-containing protein [Armatimonadota bacterium]|nr:helix-turn-helix domain-containing protein [Armatimonadota bacterium]
MTKIDRSTTDAIEIIHQEFFVGKPEMLEMLEEERVNADIARMIYQLRTDAGLTQQQLAEKINTSTAVICRLEEADYEGHSLAMLRRIADALDCRVNIDFAPKSSKALESSALVTVQ